MSTAPDATPPTGPRYKQQLARDIGVFGAVLITVSGITPTASIFIDAPVAFPGQGSGVVWSFAIAAIIAFGLAFCYAELGSMFPVTGGLYSVVTRVLGRPAGFIGFVDYLVLAIVGPSTIGLGTAQYVGVFLPQVSAPLIGVILIIGTMLVAMLSIKGNALVTGIFLSIEMLIVATLVVLGFTHINQPLDVLLRPHTYSATGTLTAVGFGGILAGVVIALGSYNGYDAPITFSEEMKDPRRGVPRAVLLSVAVAVICEFLAVTAVILGSPSLEALTTAPTPMSYFIRAVGGDLLDDIITLGVILAIVNASIVGMLALGRLVYSSGRDRAWPEPISGWLTYVHPRFKTPVVATAVIGVLAALLSAFVNLSQIVEIASLLLVVMYVLVALSAIVTRFTQKDRLRPYRMPLWPLPPVLALIGCLIVLTQQDPSDLILLGAIFLIAVLYYVLYLRPRSQTHWVMLNPTVPGDPSTAAGARS